VGHDRTNRFGSAVDVATATNADAVLTYAAVGAAVSHILVAVYWSYSGGAPAGRLTVSDGANVIVDLDITSAGPGFLEIPSPYRITPGNALEVRLYNGGAGIVGKVTARHWPDVI
jgi:hypothetical protein